MPLPKAVEMPGQCSQNGLSLGLFPHWGVRFGVSEESLMQRADFQLDKRSKRSLHMQCVCSMQCIELCEQVTGFCCECPQPHWMGSKSQILNPLCELKFFSCCKPLPVHLKPSDFSHSWIYFYNPFFPMIDNQYSPDRRVYSRLTNKLL